ncbi:MAG: hypothetical protein P4M13_04825 [Alphaproteobacteria bacterium]|nr:hypothetical protein [Alphaproteobacteria bacterium]
MMKDVSEKPTYAFRFKANSLGVSFGASADEVSGELNKKTHHEFMTPALIKAGFNEKAIKEHFAYLQNPAEDCDGNVRSEVLLTLNPNEPTCMPTSVGTLHVVRL